MKILKSKCNLSLSSSLALHHFLVNLNLFLNSCLQAVDCQKYQNTLFLQIPLEKSLESALLLLKGFKYFVDDSIKRPRIEAAPNSSASEQSNISSFNETSGFLAFSPKLSIWSEFSKVLNPFDSSSTKLSLPLWNYSGEISRCWDVIW